MGNNASKTSSSPDSSTSTTSDARSSTSSVVVATTTSSRTKTTPSSAMAQSTSESSSSSHRHRTATDVTSSGSALAKSTTMHASLTSTGSTQATGVTSAAPSTTCNMFGCFVITSTDSSSSHEHSTTSTLLSTSQHSTTIISSSSSSSPSSSFAVAAASTTATIAAGTSHHSGISGGAIAAAVVVPVVVIAGLLAFFFIYLRRRRSQRHRAPSSFPRHGSPGLSGTTSHTDPGSPAADDAEKVYEKDMELSPIQRSAPVGALAPTVDADFSTPPLSTAWPITGATFEPVSASTNTPPAHPLAERQFHSPTSRQLDAAFATPKMPQEVFKAPTGSSPPGSADPFRDPKPGQTPSPIATQTIDYLGTPKSRNVPATFSPSPITYTNPSLPQAASTPSRATIRAGARPDDLRSPISPGFASPAFRDSRTDSDHFMMLSDDEDDGVVVEYATAARVIGGPAVNGVDHVRNNRQSVGLVTMGPARSVSGSRSRSRPGSPAT